MGLLDQVIGSVTGKGGSTSPLTKALLLLLAAKAASSYFGKDEEKPAGGAAATPAPSGTIESGILAGLPSLDSVLDRLRGGGLGGKLDSWIGQGDNEDVKPEELDKALGSGTIDELSQKTGMPKETLLQELSRALPQVIDKLTPQGRMPGTGDRGHW